MRKGSWRVQSSYFSLQIAPYKDKTAILMQLFIQEVNTQHIPNIVDLLRLYFPSVLKTKCFNDLGLPFDREVRNTEIGHLFEHILLEKLCIYKLSSGHSKAEFNGRTNWNWKRDPRGLFHISVDAGEKDWMLFPHALNSSVELTEILLSYLLPTNGSHASHKESHVTFLTTRH